MECTRFEELLFERLEGVLDESGCEDLTAHAGKCSRCQELESMLTSPARAVEVPDDLTASVLALTSEREPLQRALRQLDLDLPAMVSITPDESFVADVMTATVEADKQRFWFRAREFWNGLAQRPRFALEGAYLGGIAIFLLVGLPGSPLAGVSDQVLNELRDENSVVRTSLSESASRVTEFSQASWTRAGHLASTAIANGLPGAPDLTQSTSWLVEVAKAVGNWWLDTFSAAIEWLQDAWLKTMRPATDDSSTEATNNNNDQHHV